MPGNVDSIARDSDRWSVGISCGICEPGIGTPGSPAVDRALVIYLRIAIPIVMPGNVDGIARDSDRRIRGISCGIGEPDLGTPGGPAVGRASVVYLFVAVPAIKPDNMDGITGGSDGWTLGIPRGITEPDLSFPIGIYG